MFCYEGQITFTSMNNIRNKGGDIALGNELQGKGCMQSAVVTPLDSSALEMDEL